VARFVLSFPQVYVNKILTALWIHSCETSRRLDLVICLSIWIPLAIVDLTSLTSVPVRLWPAVIAAHCNVKRKARNRVVAVRSPELYRSTDYWRSLAASRQMAFLKIFILHLIREALCWWRLLMYSKFTRASGTPADGNMTTVRPAHSLQKLIFFLSSEHRRIRRQGVKRPEREAVLRVVTEDHHRLNSWPVPVTTIKNFRSSFCHTSLASSALRFVLIQQLRDLVCRHSLQMF
jgi:hypothetical protein